MGVAVAPSPFLMMCRVVDPAFFMSGRMGMRAKKNVVIVGEYGPMFCRQRFFKYG